MSADAVWISRLPEDVGTALAAADGPLAGLRFAIKDNIDLAGVPTTAADPRRTAPAAASATAVELLLAAGAVPVGKTNLDQYATGLVGTRSPYGACTSVFSPLHASGGSSSGSGVAVARGEVDFALGTDTAGSGRVPAAFNEVIGVKPSKGLVSTTGVVPACRSLDCVSVFARDLGTARRVLTVLAQPDPGDPYSRRLVQRPTPARPVVAVPDGPLDLDPQHAVAWTEALTLADKLYDVVEVPVDAFLEAARLLYEGPWVAERQLAFGEALDDDPAVDPTVRAIVAGARSGAVDAFAGFHRLAELDARTRAVWEVADALLLPVTPTHPTHAAIAADPIGVNSRLGTFTNMTNLLDLCALAVPGPRREDGLPFGVQLLAPAAGDLMLLDLAAEWLGAPVAGPGERPGWSVIAVAGAHLSGQPLNGDLVARGGVLVETTSTDPSYRMYVVDGPVPRPGVTRVIGAPDGPGIEVELWALPDAAVAGFLATIAAPLGLGPVLLADGRQVTGFVATADAVDPQRDITAYGGWRRWLASR